MNKFPFLNLLRVIYLIFAVVILGGGCLGSIGLSTYLQSINTARQYDAIIIGVGIAIFVFAFVFASAFLLWSESITVLISIEGHLEYLRSSQAQNAYRPRYETMRPSYEAARHSPQVAKQPGNSAMPDANAAENDAHGYFFDQADEE